MDQRKQIQIGNEHFKQWLKSLHPVARVERMSAIAKMLASMNLRGTEIKAALAQLSQRCQVMLVRLPEKQITHYTRRNYFKKIQPSTLVSTTDTNNEKHGRQLKVVTCNVKKDKFCFKGEDNQNSCKEDRQNCYLQDLSKNSSFVFQKVLVQGSNSVRNLPLNISKRKLKKKELLKELFGEDDMDDTIADKYKKHDSKKTCDLEVNNYMSTTVNVNIYNTSSNRSLESNTSVIKTKHTEDTVMSGNEPSKKRFRIDVSLSNEVPSEEGYKKEEFLVSQSNKSVSSVENLCKRKSSKKSSSKNSRRNNGSGKKSLKKDRQKSNKVSSSITNVNGSEEDPSIKELWSIFGMESPTDRSAKFYSNPLNFETSETITLHTAPEETIICKSPNNIPETEKNYTVRAPDLLENRSVENELAESTKSPSTETDSDTVESFLKITGSFSLSDVPARGHSDIGDNVFSPLENITDNNLKVHQDKIGDDKAANNHSRRKQTTCFNNEAITLDDENNDSEINKPDIPKKEFNGVKDKRNDSPEKSIVGTIRVKSLGSMMDPQHQIDINEGAALPAKNLELSVAVKATADSEQDDSSSNISQPNVEERFFATYRHYFDDVVEVKIPKLGELLHLAIADTIRYVERIKRAEQLSSEDLIKEEKQRAEKDFSDMMKIRGIEFSPLCQTIVNKFEQSSKITLFIALFCRILKHSEIIDPANKNFTSEAKKVVHLMLRKHQFKDKGILDALHSDEEDFKDQVFRVRNLIEKCLYNNTPIGSASSTLLKTNVDVNNHVTYNAVSNDKVSQAPTLIHSVSAPVTSISGNLNSSNYASQLYNTSSTANRNKSSNIVSTSTLSGSKKNILTNNPANFNLTNSMTTNAIQKQTLMPSVNRTANEVSKLLTLSNPGEINIPVATPQSGIFHAVSAQAISINDIRNNYSKQKLDNAALLNSIQKLIKQNSDSNTKKSIPKNNINCKEKANVVAKSANRPAPRNILKKQLETPAKSGAVSNRTSVNDLQTNIALQSNSAPLQVSHASPISFAIVSIPQTATITSSSFGVETTLHVPNQFLQNSPNVAVLNQKSSLNLGNTVNASALRYTQTQVNQSVIQPSSQPKTVLQPLQQIHDASYLPAQSRLNFISNPNTFSGSKDIYNGLKQSLETLQRREVHQPGFNQPNSVGPMIVREVVDPSIPAIVGMDLNQLPSLEENTQSTSEVSAASLANLSVAGGANSSNLPVNADVEVTSPTAQPNIPLSSHCHPFGKRMPISGKMRMFFGNNANS